MNALTNLNVSDSRQYWKNYKRTLTDKPGQYMGNLIEGGILNTDRGKKEEILFNAFFSGDHMAEGVFNKTFEKDIDRKYEVILSSGFELTKSDPIIEEHLNGDVQSDEVVSMIRAQKSTAKSFDIDELHPRILKHLPKSAILKVNKKIF